ncbi:long-chain acyl-CoA synthetase [Methanolinea mesophila]|uniref:class I adenylate-forming enzyme family protein n=1 Tax=Methanolinea mesophila TaxID=547055 RepID=UPI001AE90F3B|nr:class I adenylate-forming enzyme family protein [Methanolinea mesophila]MBP1928754.1 long-chain acyl-CoA synthetase [Methanolinea mesophila]
MPNVTTFLDQHACDPALVALRVPHTGESLTYAELLEQACRLGNGLKSRGIAKGDRVCIYLDSSPRYLVCYFALWRIGAVAVPANIVYKADELAHVLRDSGARGLICAGGSAAVIAEDAVKGVPGVDVVIRVGEGRFGESWDEVLLTASPELPAEHCGFDHPCQLQYTAGTTGRPKGAVLTHGNWMAALDAEREVLSLRAGDVYLGIYPMGHVGVSWGIAALRAGGTYLIMERFSEQEYLDICRDFCVTVLAAMPPVIHTLAGAPQGTEDSLRTVRVIISGGGQLLPVIWEKFDLRYGIPIANSYGLSETIVVGTGTATIPDHPELTRNYQSVGCPVGYSEVRIVDPDDPGCMLSSGEPGEIALRGPAVALGYWNLPEASAEHFRPDGWFLTGDIGYLDPGGVLFITDRKKDMIIMSGWKVYPTEVENVILQHPKVADVAVFGRDDPRKGEIPVAAVVLVAGETLTAEELEEFCRARMAGYKIPREMIVLPSLPRAHGWKLLRRSLREQFG